MKKTQINNQGEFMKKLLILFMVCMSFTVFAKSKDVNIVLKDNNFFAVTEAFTETLLEKFNRKIMTYDGKEMFIYLDSPGGSVFAMSRIIGIMKASDIKFTCVARFAASAAFAMFQQCDNRYMLYDGIIMQHNASGGFRGEFPRIYSLLNAINDLVKDVEKNSARRMKMKLKDYKVAINNNLWLSRATASKYGAVDNIINNIKCSPGLVKKVVNKAIRKCGWLSCTVSYKKFSGCPLLTQPLPKKDKSKEEDDTEWKEDINTGIKDFMWIYRGNLPFRDK